MNGDIVPAVLYDAVVEKLERLEALYERTRDHPPKCIPRKREESLARLVVEADVLNDLTERELGQSWPSLRTQINQPLRGNVFPGGDPQDHGP